jgi:hypothetical protein
MATASTVALEALCETESGLQVAPHQPRAVT